MTNRNRKRKANRHTPLQRKRATPLHQRPARKSSKTRPLGPGTKNITANSTAAKNEYMRARAKEAGGWTISKFAGVLIDNWFANGCPPIWKKDAKIPIPEEALVPRWGDVDLD